MSRPPAIATLRAPSPVMRQRLFPVAVQVPGADGDPTLFESALYWETDDRTEVWVLGPDRRPTLALRGPARVGERERLRTADRLVNGRQAKWQATLADGTVWQIGTAPGCGCGNPLKSFSPPAEVSA